MNRRRIFAVVAARNREFYRDKSGLGWNIFVPIVLLLGFAFIFAQADDELFSIGVLGDTVGQPLADLQHVRLVRLQDKNEAMKRLRYHGIDLLVDLRAAPQYWRNTESARGYAAERLLLQQYNTSPPELHRELVSGQEIRYVDWLVPGVLGMNIMFSALWGVGWVIVRYRKNGVLRRLRATPLTAGEFLVAQVISRLYVVVLANILVFALTIALLDFPMRGSYAALLAVLVVGSVALISLGLLVAARVRSEEFANGLLNVLAIPMMILCGVWFSLDGAHVAVLWLAEALPLTHVVDAARRIMLDGAGMADVAFELVLLSGISVLLLYLSSKTFRWV